MNDDEFYVGYLHPALPHTGRWMRRSVVVAILGSAFAAGLLVGVLRPFDPGFFEFGSPRDYDGVLVMKPVPSLLVERPGVPGGLPGFSRLWLVGPGKGGADPLVAALDGQAVHVRAEAVYRDGQTLLKLHEGAITALPADGQDHATAVALASAAKPIGPIELTGEIVDPQCFFGLMKPGYGVPHRACAIRCLAGGVPPVLFSRDANGGPHYHLLLGMNGERINRALLPFAAEPVRLRGTEVAYGETLAIHLDPASLSAEAGR